jgi:1-phosphatidylinositol-3-phosphate 5-kinase
MKFLQNTSELRNLWIQVYHTSDGLQFQTRYLNKFKKINNCITNTELIEWLMRKKSVSRDQAIVIGQALVQGKWLQSATNSNPDHIFSDEFSFYKPGIVKKKKSFFFT